MFHFLPIHLKRDIKTGRSCLRTNIEATQREGGPLTQLSARGISSAAVRSPFYCRLRSRPFFLVLFPSCFLRLPSSASLFLPCSLPPALSVCALPAWLDSAVTAILSSYAIRLHLLSFPLRHQSCRLKIPRAIVTTESCNGLNFKQTDLYEPKMETP